MASNESDPTSLAEVSPPSSRHYGLTQGEARILHSVHAFFQREASDQMRIGLARVVDRLAAATGYSERTLRAVLAQSPSDFRSDSKSITRRRQSKAPPTSKVMLRKCIRDIYNQKQYPTLDLMLQELGPQWPLGRTKLSITLAELGFKHSSPRSYYDRVKEQSWVVEARRTYIDSIREYRCLGYEVFYQDETWWNANMTVKYCWHTDEGDGGFDLPSGIGARLMVVHIGSSIRGLLPGAQLVFDGKTKSDDYHDNMNCDNFERWFETQVLTNIPDHSVIVLDHAKYHRRLTSQTAPCREPTKATIIDWLVSKDATLDVETLQKKKVVDLKALAKTMTPQPKLVVEALAEATGKDIKIIFLPKSHPELNPIEGIWALVKQYIRKRNVSGGLKAVGKLGIEALQTIRPEDFNGFEKQAIQEEDAYYNLLDCELGANSASESSDETDD